MQERRGGARTQDLREDADGILAGPDIERPLVWGAPLFARERSLLDLRVDAHRQHRARLVLLARGVYRALGGQGHAQLHPGSPGGRRGCRGHRVHHAAGIFGPFLPSDPRPGLADDGLLVCLRGRDATRLGRRSAAAVDPRAPGALRGHRACLLPCLPRLRDRGRRCSGVFVVARPRKNTPRRDPARRSGRSGDGPRVGDRCRPSAHGHVRPRGCLSRSRRRDGRSVSRSLSRGR